ncbi:MAG: TetR/AcrR family transcriptional regulator [Myxococcota bacterium]
MPARARITARKAPKQERSRAMVDALLDATTRILLKDGWDGLSTNKVAAMAGVSVGSLYQYFPSKEALVHEVLQRWGLRLMEDMQQLAVDLADASVAEGIPILVKVALDISRVDVKLHRALLEQVPKVGALDALEQLNRRLADLLAVWLERHADDLQVDDPALAAHVVVQVLSRLTDNALLYRAELLTSPRFQRHLERLVRAYLTAPKSFG